MTLSTEDLAKLMILKEKIESVQQQQKWTGDSLAGLKRIHRWKLKFKEDDDEREAKIKRITTEAEGHLRDMNRELKELWAQKEAIEEKVEW